MSHKIGVVGLGHLGKIHLACLQDTKFEISGCFDLDRLKLNELASTYQIPAFDDLKSLIDASDVIDIVSSTSSHYEIAKLAIENGKHVFIEKPFVEELEEGEELKQLAEANGVLVQLGHVERYNPVVKAIENIGLEPKFIEAHRLATFNPRGNDVSVVMDLMIHDLDLLCSFINSEIDSIDANGVNVVENSPDICNARIKFKNGAVANLTASRISMKQMRKFRIFQGDRYISLDLLNKDCQLISLSENGEEGDMSFETAVGKKYIKMSSPVIKEHNAIQREFEDFYRAIDGEIPVNVTIDDGLRSLKMAKMIQDSIFVNNQKLL